MADNVSKVANIVACMISDLDFILEFLHLRLDGFSGVKDLVSRCGFAVGFLAISL